MFAYVLHASTKLHDAPLCAGLHYSPFCKQHVRVHSPSIYCNAQHRRLGAATRRARAVRAPYHGVRAARASAPRCAARKRRKARLAASLR
eukprot:3470539-Lingulodinium_polyedra.AAC.1